MATKFQDIYDLFLSGIQDYELANIDEDVIDRFLKQYLLLSLPYVIEANSDIEDIDVENEQFNIDLTLTEQALVAKAMTIVWVDRERKNLDILRKTVGDRDYKTVSTADQLKQLTNTHTALRKELEQQLIDYSYRRGNNWSSFYRG
ncbi:MAG: hypothetical protein HXO06_00090 [Prevotella salivae]|uniref:hypothetical protein n=1 Tax=Segatella salivae TaxID=228604 RepID=UPI001CB1F393|nr:hypothetical protein [Segatella salivae]MBF1543574.1 hypothetical protein [Segatella salivae]